MEDSLQSAQSFIRALKSNRDPPHVNGPTKITIARAGWESNALYLPRKAGVILDWLLPSMYKETKDKLNPGQLDLAYWDLLADILKNAGDTQIKPIILRFPVHVWVTTFFVTYATGPPKSREQLLTRFTQVLDIVWPTLTQRAALDALTDCLGPSFNVIIELGIKDVNENLNAVLNLILSGFMRSFTNSNVTARKKTYATFCQHHLLPWLHAVYILKVMHPVGRHLYDLGINILYNPDSLRVTLENNPNSKAYTSICSIIFCASIKNDAIARSSLIQILPRLYRTYSSALRHHRSTIFSGSSSKTTVRERILQLTSKFFNETWNFLCDLKEVEPPHIIWTTVADILQVMEEESLFDLAYSHELTELLNWLSKEASILLDCTWDDSQSILTTHALNIFACLHRIEPDLIVHLVPHILQRIVTASSLLQLPARKFLTLLVSYHSKTRTLPSLVSLLFSALTTPFSHLPHSDSLAIYRLCVSSPFLSITTVNELTQAFGHFVTPGQAHELVVLSTSTVTKSLRQASEVSTQKRAKLVSQKSKTLSGVTYDESTAVIAYALTSRFGASVLHILISGNVLKRAIEERQRYLEDLDTSISMALNETITSLSQDRNRAFSLGKRSHPDHLEELWTRHCLCASHLRIWYEVLGEEKLHLKASEVLSRLLSDILAFMSEGTFPELQLEVGRVVFALMTTTMSLQATSEINNRTLDILLDYVEKNLLSIQRPIFNTLHVNFPAFHDSAEKAALGLWGLLLERFLPTLEASASNEQLHRLVSFISCVDSAAIFTGEAENVVTKAFNSAYFWELPRIRESMNSRMETQTAAFASIDGASLIDAMVRGESSLIKARIMSCKATLVDAKSAAGMFNLMHHFPPDYLFKISKLDLVTRALNADVYVSATISEPEPMLHGVEWRAIFRSFLSKAVKEVNTKMCRDMATNPAGMVYFALLPRRHTLSATYTTSTLDLMLAIQLLAIQMATKGDDASLKNTVDYFVACNMYSQEDKSFVHKCFMRFVKALINEVNPSCFHPNALAHLHHLCVSVENGLKDALSLALASKVLFSSSEGFIDAWHAWHALISLKHWLGIARSPDVTVINRQLFRRTIDLLSDAPPDCPAISNTVLAVILSIIIIEGQTALQTEFNNMDSMLAAYIYFVSSSPPAMDACDIVLSRACKYLSPAQYQHGLNLVAEMLEDHGEESRLTIIIHLSTIFLCWAPERTSKVSYEHMSRCLRVLNQKVLFTSDGSELTRHTLDFIQCLFTDRAATLKPFDVNCALSILSKAVVGCPEHDMHTSTSIFRGIVNILNTTVRLRRDLLSPLLPQLAMVLRQLMTLIRCVRPHLGSRQHSAVADTFPKWINPSEALGSDDARALSRLLAAFTTKYHIRGFDNHEQKASSLARPFARHAPYVLLAYIQMMNDPLSIVTMPIRKELEPGLFSLCAMMGEHGRDTLMMQSLDTGGKALLKGLWKEYNKQKYTGRG